MLCLAAAEVYPTSVRSTAHGMSAAVGKCGALVPTVLFNYIGNTTKFWVVCWAGLLGFFMTVMFIPDATGTSVDKHAPMQVQTVTASSGRHTEASVCSDSGTCEACAHDCQPL